MRENSAPADRSARAVLGSLDESDVIERAELALDDVSEAAQFVESVGFDRLGAAVATAEGTRRQRGATVLATYLRFRVAADGGDSNRYHFHSARGTHLRPDAERFSR